MLTDLIRRLAADPDPASDPLSADDSRLALCALMVRVARQDDLYSEVERRTIEQVLAARYGMGEAAARALLAEAEALEAEAADTVQFTRAIKGGVPLEERAGVLEALWQVAANDGIKAEEHGFLRLVTNLIGVSDVDSGLARQRVLRDGA
jgi:uncharacterized tellurite resistance protein B-like protein